MVLLDGLGYVWPPKKRYIFAAVMPIGQTSPLIAILKRTAFARPLLKLSFAAQAAQLRIVWGANSNLHQSSVE